MGRNRNLKKLLTIYTKIFKFIQPEPLSLVIVGAVGSVTIKTTKSDFVVFIQNIYLDGRVRLDSTFTNSVLSNRV